MTNLIIKPLETQDFGAWRILFMGYKDFYKVPQNEDALNNTWAWLMNKDFVLKGIGAFFEDKLVGIAHYRAMPRPLSGQEIGFFDDLFTDPNFRGKGIGKALTSEIRNIAKANNWAAVRWLTADNNYNARRIYDEFATKTHFALYQMTID